MLSGCLIGTLAATILPGPGSIYVSQTFKFRKPVYLNDTVTATIQVKDINHARKFITFATKCENQHGVVVLEGDAVTLVPQEKLEDTKA